MQQRCPSKFRLRWQQLPYPANLFFLWITLKMHKIYYFWIKFNQNYWQLNTIKWFGVIYVLLLKSKARGALPSQAICNCLVLNAAVFILVGTSCFTSFQSILRFKGLVMSTGKKTPSASFWLSWCCFLQPFRFTSSHLFF